MQEAFVAAVQKNGLEHTLRWSVGIAAMISMAAVSTGDCGSLNGSPGGGELIVLWGRRSAGLDDIVIVDNDVVVPVVAGTIIVKTLWLDPNNTYFLEPANADCPAIHPKRSLQSEGAVVGNVRKYGR